MQKNNMYRQTKSCLDLDTKMYSLFPKSLIPTLVTDFIITKIRTIEIKKKSLLKKKKNEPIEIRQFKWIHLVTLFFPKIHRFPNFQFSSFSRFAIFFYHMFNGLETAGASLLFRFLPHGGKKTAEATGGRNCTSFE